MYEVSCVGGSKVDAAAAIRQSAPRAHVTYRNQMMRFLKRSKSLARPPSERDHIQHQLAEKNLRKSNSRPHQQILDPPPKQVTVARNGVVVAIVDGLPFVVKNKDKNKAAHQQHQHTPQVPFVLYFCVGFFQVGLFQVSLFQVSILQVSLL